MAKLGFDLSRLYTLDMNAVQTTALRMMMRVQSGKAANVVAAITVLFITLCERYRLDPRRVLETGDRILRDAADRRPVEVRALKTYMREELPDA